MENITCETCKNESYCIELTPQDSKFKSECQQNNLSNWEPNCEILKSKIIDKNLKITKLLNILVNIKRLPLQSKTADYLPGKRERCYEQGYEDCLWDVFSLIDKLLKEDKEVES